MTWRPVDRWVGYYEVSDAGQVRSIDREVGGRRLKGRVLRAGVNSKGYQIVVLSRTGERWAVPVHRLVGEAFIGPLPAGMATCHQDGDKNNNAAANLRYDTYSANELDKVRHGHNVNSNKTHCPSDHEYTAQNTLLTRGGHERRCRECARETKRRYDARNRERAAMPRAA